MESVVKSCHCCKHCVDSNKVCQLDWSHRVVTSELHCVVNIFRFASFHYHEGCLVLHWNKDTIYHESRKLWSIYCCLSNLSCKFFHYIICLIGCYKSTNQLKKLHNRCRIEEVCSHYFVLTVCNRCYLRDTQS